MVIPPPVARHGSPSFLNLPSRQTPTAHAPHAVVSTHVLLRCLVVAVQYYRPSGHDRTQSVNLKTVRHLDRDRSMHFWAVFHSLAKAGFRVGFADVQPPRSRFYSHLLENHRCGGRETSCSSVRPQRTTPRSAYPRVAPKRESSRKLRGYVGTCPACRLLPCF